MLLLPAVVSAIWLAVARTRPGGQEAPFAPTTQVGRVALASVVVMVAVALSGAALVVTVPAGAVMAGLAAWARWVQRDRGLLLVVPLVFGVSTLLLPLVME